MVRRFRDLATINTKYFSAAKKAGKPLILEEFGVTGTGTYLSTFLLPSVLTSGNLANQSEIYPVWVEHALETSHG